MDNDAVRDLLSTIGMKESLSQRFHRASAIPTGSSEISPDQWPAEWLTTYYKSYPRFALIPLPSPRLSPQIRLKKAIEQRRSSRHFSNIITLQQLSTLLYYSAGLKDLRFPDGPNRFYPSAGARYPLEIYLAAWDIADLTPGLYHYYVKGHALEELVATATIKDDTAKCFIPDWISTGKCVFIVTSVPFRTHVKYGDRGYRHALLEAGHLSQNLAILASAVGVSCCNCGGFVDETINALLDIDGEEEMTISTSILG